MIKHFLLNKETGELIPTDLMTWGEMLQKREHVLWQEEKGGVQVSTIFLGMDHSFGFGLPLYFETMVFGGPCDQEMERYATMEEARVGHAAMCTRVFSPSLA